MTVLFSPEAEEDFGIAVAYLTTRNPSAARALAERIFAVVDQLCDGSFEGAERELSTGERVYSFPVPPLRIYYQRDGHTLWVLRIYDQRWRPIER